MAARKNKFVSNETREKIQASQLINRLQSFVNSEIELSPAQVTAALGLLKKTLPDLAAQEISGPDGGAIEIEHGLSTDDRAILERYVTQHLKEPK